MISDVQHVIFLFQALIEKNAVEIVKQMQRLKGLDDEYDSDSAASNRLQTR